MTSDRPINENRDVFHRILRFSVLPIASVLSPLVALPILARSVSLEEWAAIAIGQSIGGIAALAVGNGWNISGPVLVASPDARRSEVLNTAMFARLLMLLAVLPILVGLAFLLPTHGERLLVTAVAASTAIGGLGMAWYAIGAGRPGILAAFEVAPRVVANIVGALAAYSTGNALLYPAVTAATQVLAVVVFWRRESGSSWLSWRGAGTIASIRRHRAATGTEIIAGLYSIGASAIVAILGTAATVSIFNTGYRLVSFGAIAVGTLSNGLIGWVAESTGQEFVRRVRISLRLHTALGVVGLAALAAVGPALSGVVFGPELRVPWQVMAALGVFFLLWSIETVTSRHILAARGRTRAMFISTSVGSAVGVVGLLFASRHGPTEAAWALAGALAVIVAQQAVGAYAVIRHEPRTSIS